MDTDKMKLQVLASILSLSSDLQSKIQILNALDHDSASSGYLDLHDQLISLFESRTKLDRAVSRAIAVVPK